MPVSSKPHGPQPSPVTSSNAPYPLCCSLPHVPLSQNPSQQAGSYPVEVGRETCTMDHVTVAAQVAWAALAHATRAAVPQAPLGVAARLTRDPAA